MDLNRVTEFYQPKVLEAVPKWQEGFAWLAGGTWLFSEPQPSVCALIDLDTLSWPALQIHPRGLEISSTCKIVELEAFRAPSEWRAASLIIGTLCPVTGTLRITVTASTVRPIALVFDDYPDTAELAAAIDEFVSAHLYFDDPHGTREHRRHLTYYYAEQIRAELEAGDEGI
jgi:hypothetical protein